MSHASGADEFLIEPAAGARRAAHTRADHSQGTHGVSGHLTSHARHSERGWRAPQIDTLAESHSQPKRIRPDLKLEAVCASCP